MDQKLRSHLISIAVLLFGVLLSGVLFFLNWVFGDRARWDNWLMTLSYASFLGSLLVAFLIQVGIRYALPKWRVVGFFLVIGWIAASLFSTTLETVAIFSQHVAQGISYTIVIGGLAVLVVPGFLLMLLPWPPRFLTRKNGDDGDLSKPGRRR